MSDLPPFGKRPGETHIGAAMSGLASPLVARLSTPDLAILVCLCLQRRQHSRAEERGLAC